MEKQPSEFEMGPDMKKLPTPLRVDPTAAKEVNEALSARAKAANTFEEPYGQYNTLAAGVTDAEGRLQTKKEEIASIASHRTNIDARFLAARPDDHAAWLALSKAASLERSVQEQFDAVKKKYDAQKKKIDEELLKNPAQDELEKLNQRQKENEVEFGDVQKALEKAHIAHEAANQNFRKLDISSLAFVKTIEQLDTDKARLEGELPGLSEKLIDAKKAQLLGERPFEASRHEFNETFAKTGESLVRQHAAFVEMMSEAGNRATDMEAALKLKELPAGTELDPALVKLLVPEGVDPEIAELINAALVTRANKAAEFVRAQEEVAKKKSDADAANAAYESKKKEFDQKAKQRDDKIRRLENDHPDDYKRHQTLEAAQTKRDQAEEAIKKAQGGQKKGQQRNQQQQIDTLRAELEGAEAAFKNAQSDFDKVPDSVRGVLDEIGVLNKELNGDLGKDVDTLKQKSREANDTYDRASATVETAHHTYASAETQVKSLERDFPKEVGAMREATAKKRAEEKAAAEHAARVAEIQSQIPTQKTPESPLVAPVTSVLEKSRLETAAAHAKEAENEMDEANKAEWEARKELSEAVGVLNQRESIVAKMKPLGEAAKETLERMEAELKEKQREEEEVRRQLAEEKAKEEAAKAALDAAQGETDPAKKQAAFAIASKALAEVKQRIPALEQGLVVLGLDIANREKALTRRRTELAKPIEEYEAAIKRCDEAKEEAGKKYVAHMEAKSTLEGKENHYDAARSELTVARFKSNRYLGTLKLVTNTAPHYVKRAVLTVSRGLARSKVGRILGAAYRGFKKYVLKPVGKMLKWALIGAGFTAFVAGGAIAQTMKGPEKKDDKKK